MTQSGRNKLYGLAYMLDTHPRVKERSGKYSPVSDNAVLKLKMQEHTADLRVIYTDDELSKIAEEIREVVRDDEKRGERSKL